MTISRWGYVHEWKFEPRDLWVGVYWTRADLTTWGEFERGEVYVGRVLHLYVCLIPTVVLHLWGWLRPH